MNTTTPTIGQTYIVRDRFGAAAGRGELVAIDGKQITIAQTVRCYVGADGAADAYAGDELELAQFTLGARAHRIEVAA